jgi:hypothetical protein
MRRLIVVRMSARKTPGLGVLRPAGPGHSPHLGGQILKLRKPTAIADRHGLLVAGLPFSRIAAATSGAYRL